MLRLAKRAGVKLTMHSLRKGFGCYYAARVPAQVLQKLMRHADIETTMAYMPTWTTPWRPPSPDVTIHVTPPHRPRNPPERLKAQIAEE